MYRGEIQNDSIGGNYNRSLAYSPSVSGLGDGGRGETRNFAVGAPLRGAGIGRCEEDEYNCCGLYGRGENEEMEDDPCWDGYEMIGTKMKKGREVPNCVPVGGYGERPEGATEVPNMTDFIRLFSLGNKENARKLEKTIYGEGKPFTKEQLTKIILDKNKVIADLEENAYGGGWQEEMFSPEEIAEAEKNWQDYVAKNPQLKGEGFWDDVRKGLVKHNERKKNRVISEEDWKKQMADFKAPTENWGADEGGAAPKVEPKPPSGVAAAAAALQPVRTAIQNKVGDLIYGAETDPKKQRKGLLGISEEGKEASKKKVIKNIVKPLMDGWNQLFNPDKVKEQNLAKGRTEAKKAKAKAGWLYEMPDGSYDVLLGLTTDDPNAKLVRQPRRYRRWVVKNAAKNIGYWVDDYDEGSPPYIKIPNPIKGIKPNYTIAELKKNNIPFFVPVNRVNKTTDNEEVWRGLFEGDEIWVPQDNTAPVLYQRLNEFKNKMEEEKERAYYESLPEVEKQEYRENKALEKDTGMTEAAKAKVEKDIADEEAKEKPDTERLAKMKAAQERVRIKGVENFQKAQTQTKKVSERKYREQTAREAAERQAANAKEQADAAATFKAMSPAERSAQIDAYRKDLQEQGWREEDIEDAVSQIGEQGVVAVGGGFFDDIFKQRDKEAKEKTDKMSPEEKLRAEILETIRIHGKQADFFNKSRFAKLAKLDADYESNLARRIADAKATGRPVNESAIAAIRRQRIKDAEDFAKQLKISGGAGSDDEDSDDESVEEVKAIEVIMSKKERYFVDAPVRNEKGELVGLPLGTFKKAISGVMGIGNRRVYDPESGDIIGYLKDPLWKKVAMKVYNSEKEWRAANLKKLGFAMDEDTDGDSVASASSRGGGGEPDDDELVGEGAIEFTLQKAGKSLFNPTGDMTMAGKQTFTPDYDAYGATVADGRLNAFNLSRSMYNQQQAIDLPDFDLIEDNTSLRFYLKDDEDVIMVGIRGTDVKSWTDLYTWAVIGANQDFRMTTRFQDDLQKLLVFQKEYPMTQYYYVGVGSSLAGSIADRFLDMGLIDEAITYNPSIEKKYVLDGDIHNHRVYLDTDPLFILMGQYAPNTEIRANAGKTNFYNPIKEKEYLIKSHSIFPVYNPAFEGGGMMGAGKTYTIEEWKAIFDAKLEQKRQQIEAREAKKKQTAKAKRERAKARRDGRDEPPPLETPATFRTSRVMKATPPREPEPAPPAPKKRKPRLKVVAPAKDEPPPLEAPFRTSRVMKATPPIVKRTARQRERDEEIERLKEVIKSAQAEQRRIDAFLEGFEGLTPAGQRAIKSSQEDRSEEWRREKKARGQLNALQIEESDEIDAQIAAEKVAKFMRENDGRKPLVREEIRTRADEERLGVTKYKFGTKFYYVEDPRNDGDMNLGFYKSRQVLEAYDDRGRVTIVYIGRLGEEKQPFQGLMKQIIKAEFPSEKVYRETMGLEAPPKKPKAPASARVDLRQELVAEQPRKPEGEFASEAEPLQLVVTEIAKQPQGAFMKLMKSPKLTEADRRLFMRLKETKMTPKMRAILLGRSGLARRVMEIMGLDESAFQTKKARLKIADTTEMRVKSETAREIDAQGWIDIKKEWKKAATSEINSVLKRTGNREPAVKSAKDTLKDIAEWCVASVECLRDAMITDWQGAWTINQEGRTVDADGDKFFSRGKVGTDVWKNKTPLLTIKDTTKTASDTGQESDEVRTYNLVIGEKGQAILLDGGGDGYEKWTIPMRTLYGFFPLMGLPIPTCKKQGRYGMMKLEIDWKEMPLVRSYKSLTAKAKEEIQEKLRSEYAPKLTAFIDIARSKLEEIVEEAIKGRVKYSEGRQPLSKWHTETWVPEE